MKNSIRTIALEKLVAHPGNANRQSRAVFSKLVRNISDSGLYEPLVVRPHPKQAGFFEIINGYHRWRALDKLGYKTADCVVWEVDDEQALILLATLNRLGGKDVLAKKLGLIRKLNAKMAARELAKLLPQTAKQIERLCNLKMPTAPVKPNTKPPAEPMVFFVTDRQKKIIEKALSIGQQTKDKKTKAERKAAALSVMAVNFINNSTIKFKGF